MAKTKMLRFASEDDMKRELGARRERFSSGSRGREPEREADVQSAGLELLKHHPAIAFAYRSNSRAGFMLNPDVYDRLVKAGHLKRTEARFMRFGVKGAHDVTGMLRGGRRLEIEFKGDGGKLSEDQRAYAEAVNGGGGLAIVAYSVTELVDELARGTK